MNNEELIGKKVYKVSRYGIDSIAGVIDRVTRTTACVGTYLKFRLPISDRLSRIGSSQSWGIYWYELETLALNTEWEKIKLLIKIKELAHKLNVNAPTEISLENLQKVVEILTKKTIERLR